MHCEADKNAICTILMQHVTCSEQQVASNKLNATSDNMKRVRHATYNIVNSHTIIVTCSM